MLTMNTLRSFFTLIAASVLAIATAYSQYDDIYFNPEKDVKVYTAADFKDKADWKTYDEPATAGSGERTDATDAPNPNAARSYEKYRDADDNGGYSFVDNRQSENTSYTYTDQSQDYPYTSRIRRFNRPIYGRGFYDPYYVSGVYYDPFFSNAAPGTQVALSFGNVPVANRWNSWNRWNAWNQPAFGWNRWNAPAWNNWNRWNDPWANPYANTFGTPFGGGFGAGGFGGGGFNNAYYCPPTYWTGGVPVTGGTATPTTPAQVNPNPRDNRGTYSGRRDADNRYTRNTRTTTNDRQINARSNDSRTTQSTTTDRRRTQRTRATRSTDNRSRTYNSTGSTRSNSRSSMRTQRSTPQRNYTPSRSSRSNSSTFNRSSRTPSRSNSTFRSSPRPSSRSATPSRGSSSSRRR